MIASFVHELENSEGKQFLAKISISKGIFKKKFALKGESHWGGHYKIFKFTPFVHYSAWGASERVALHGRVTGFGGNINIVA